MIFSSTFWYRFKRLAMGFPAFVLLYEVTNFVHVREPVLVPALEVDRLIPFNPEWIWIYFFTYFFALSPVFFLEVKKIGPRYGRPFVTISIFSAIVFFLFPTTIDRSLYPFNANENWSTWALAILRGIDQPTNCVPSLHVSLSFLAAITWSNEFKGFKKILPWLIFLAISFSTMATKQHYFWDVLTGAFVGLIAFLLFTRLARSLTLAGQTKVK
jgi:membrane-associated phospholipid phosphatase